MQARDGGRTARSAGVYWLIVGVAIGSVIGAPAWGWLRSDSNRTSEQPSIESKVPSDLVELSEEAQRNSAVSTASVSLSTLPTMLNLTGVVTPEESRVAHIRPLARGLIEEVSVRLGDRVRKGQPLVTYDNIALGELIGEYLTERAALRQAETNRDVKDAVLERGEALFKTEAIALQVLEQRRAEFTQAKAAVDSAKARVSKIEEQIHRFGLSDADLAQLRPEEGHTPHRMASHNVMRAPFDGIITKYDVAPGEVVQPEHELFTLTNLSTVWVLADV